jgi:thioredoxin-related protein
LVECNLLKIKKQKQTSVKKIIFILSIIISTTSCKKEPVENLEVSETNQTFDKTLEYNKSLKPLIFEFTSTGCPGCGSWGKPTFVS